MKITIEQILKALAGGVTMDALLEDYPELEMADLQAALHYASEIVRWHGECAADYQHGQSRRTGSKTAAHLKQESTITAGCS